MRDEGRLVHAVADPGGLEGLVRAPPFLPRFYSKVGGCGQNRAPRPPSLAKYL